MKTSKKICALLGTFLLLQTTAAYTGGEEPFLTTSTAWAADYVAPDWLEDIDEATRDDTIAFGIYVGKPIQTVVDDLAKKGWQRKDNNNTVIMLKKKNGYMQLIALHPHGKDNNLVGNYRIRFYAKDSATADEMYMRAEKNFSYNFGRPQVKKGMANATWFLSDSFAIMVEYNQYDPRMPLIKDAYPNEIVIKREMGNYKAFFEGE
ncbi:MAG: hypothetical protein E7200_03350 [Selenomonas ruminantium]|nr:hypothetical protein [Selenomonas ruminantium]